MDLYSIRIPRGEPCGLRLSQKLRCRDIIVTNISQTLPNNTHNHLFGRIGIYDKIIQVGDHLLTTMDDLQDIIKLITTPPDSQPVRITFQEQSLPLIKTVLL